MRADVLLGHCERIHQNAHLARVQPRHVHSLVVIKVKLAAFLQQSGEVGISADRVLVAVLFCENYSNIFIGQNVRVHEHRFAHFDQSGLHGQEVVVEQAFVQRSPRAGHIADVVGDELTLCGVRLEREQFGQ
uniref:(northern house mosquito) hypothetical protein n=1 Tax=Culex pipiens TaxID=7175 RepID=A0A8D8CQ67_CULPI